MSKTLNDLIRGNHIPQRVIEQMEKTEPGMLSAALGAMVYARSHDGKMNSVFPEKVYLGNPKGPAWMQKNLGSEDAYIKTDVAITKTIELLDALALQHALENR